MLSPADTARFWSNVSKSDDCWTWTGRRTEYGYGRAFFNGKMLRAHRLAWELANGPIPDGLCVLHACDNPPCVRVGPGHLFLGTQLDNMHDCIAKGRARHRSPSGEQNGFARLTADAVRSIRSDELAIAGRWTELARKHGCSPRTVEFVVKRVTWKHVI